mmetsp:Transcript_19592/g.45043  ORF Transcript_19592/g.45043 Transcript_19592/m.45043 type:complete len:234 (-) Transcript_19592:43-744(-)
MVEYMRRSMLKPSGCISMLDMARSVLRIISRISCGLRAVSSDWRSTSGSLRMWPSSGLLSTICCICGLDKSIERSISGLFRISAIMGESSSCRISSGFCVSICCTCCCICCCAPPIALPAPSSPNGSNSDGSDDGAATGSAASTRAAGAGTLQGEAAPRTRCMFAPSITPEALSVLGSLRTRPLYTSRCASALIPDESSSSAFRSSTLMDASTSSLTEVPPPSLIVMIIQAKI